MGRNDNKNSNKNQKKAPKDASEGSKHVSDYQAGKKSKSDTDIKKK